MYKIGDKVIVSYDLTEGYSSGKMYVASDMLRYRGQEMTITSIDSDDSFTFEEDNGDWFWTTDMLVDKLYELNRTLRAKCMLTTA